MSTVRNQTVSSVNCFNFKGTYVLLEVGERTNERKTTSASLQGTTCPPYIKQIKKKNIKNNNVYKAAT